MANFEDYMTYSEIGEYLSALSDQLDWVESFSIGSTFEGREMWTLSVTKAGEGAQNILVEGGEIRKYY